MTSPLVSTACLAERLSDPKVRIIDGSWHMPADNRDAAAEYRAARIPGAVHFDIDAISDHTSPLPHMLPTPEAFAEAVGALGVGDEDDIVIYDSRGLFSAPRVWWMFRVMGRHGVKVLDGGLPRWLAEGRPVESGAPAPNAPKTFTPGFRPELLRDADAVLEATNGGAQIIDARAAARFRGEAPEPRPGLRAGHIPGSLNLPWGELLEDGALIPPAQIKQRFEAAGLDLSAPIITTCGSGISAAILTLALTALGRWDVPVYDGSWTEWGGDPRLPVATGS